MPNESPLLTIAIPTYNRSRYLGRLLHSLTPQLQAREDHSVRVELLISDNASSDDTQAVLDGYRDQGFAFRNLRNPINVGADGNIAQCFAEASGRYVWIIGDDDVVLPGALAILVALLAQDEYDIIHMRGRPTIADSDVKKILRAPRIEIVEDACIFVRKTHVYLTFISGNIINKQRVLCLPHRPFSELMGTSLIQLGWTYTALRHFRKGAYIVDPLIAASDDARGGYPAVTIFGTNLERITRTWLVKPALVRIVLNGTLQTFFPFLVLRMRLGDKSFIEDNYADILYNLFSDKYRYYFFLYPILRLPGRVGRMWFFLIRVINRLDRALGNPMLR